MYQQIIPLSPSQSLVLTWEKGWHNLTIKKDNQIIGAFKDVHDLKTGRNFQIPDFGTVFIRMDRDQIEAWQNGKDLATGLVSGQANHFKTAWQSLYLLATINVVVALVTVPRHPDLYLGLFFAASILVFAGLAFWAQKKEDVLPLWIAVGLTGISGLLTILSAPSIFTLALTGALLFVLIRGARTGPLKVVSRAMRVELGEGGPLDAGV